MILIYVACGLASVLLIAYAINSGSVMAAIGGGALLMVYLVPAMKKDGF